MTQHTKNLLIDITDLGCKDAPSGFYTICDEKKRIVAYVKMGAFPDEKTRKDLDLDEGKSNLKLFRSSPELLEACMVALELLEKNQDGAQRYLKGHYNVLTNAIEKATK